MERRSRISLDDPAFRGRLRAPRRAVLSTSPRTHNGHGGMDGLRSAPVVHKVVAPKPVVHHQPAVSKPSPQVRQLPIAPPINRLRTHTEAFNHAPAKQTHLPRQSRSGVLRRQMVEKVAKQYRSKNRRPLMPIMLSGMAIVLFTIGLVVVFSSLRTDRTVKAQVKQLSAEKKDDDGMTNGAPSEDEPSGNIGAYRVAPDEPRIVTIEKFGVNARIRRLGVGADNTMKAPANIFDAGWYEGSSKPGSNGTVVLNGHVSGPTKHGVFYDIHSLKPGDKVQIERGDGQVFTYTVTGSEVFEADKVDMTKVLTSSVPGKPGLNLITCTGKFNVRTNSFEKRVVVFTTQD